MGPRQTRSKGPADDPDLEEGDFWLKHQEGAVKDRVKGTHLPQSSNTGFLTLKVSTKKLRELSVAEGVHKAGVPSAAGTFVSLTTGTPEEETQRVDKRTDSIADSAVDLNTPAADTIPVGGSSVSTPGQRRSSSRPEDIQTPDRPSVSPLTPPQEQVESLDVNDTAENQGTEASELQIQFDFNQSLRSGAVHSSDRTNEHTIVVKSVTPAIQQSPHYPDTAAPVLAPSCDSQQLHYSLEPSPKTHTQDLEQTPPAPFPTTSIESVLTESHPHSNNYISTQQLIVSSLNEYHINEEPRGGPVEPAQHLPAAVILGPQSPSATLASPAAESVSEQGHFGPRKQSPSKRLLTPSHAPPAKRKPGRPQRSSPVKQSVEPAVERPKPSLVVKLPIPQGYILNDKMAPVRDPQDVSNSMKEIIQNMYDTTQTVVGFVPESQELLIDRMAELTENLGHLQKITNASTSPNNPVHKIHIAPEIVDYVDDGRNPDIFTRDFVELVQRGNAVMHGKKKAFSSFAEIYAKELKKGIGGIDKQVDLVMSNAGLVVPEDGDDAKKTGEGREGRHENGEGSKSS